MIISASYKTDLPAFYGDWFVNRLRAGHCTVASPYGRGSSRVDLSPFMVEGFVFWTKNIHPFLPHLAEVHDRGFPFVIQHTMTGYPRELEPSGTDVTQAIDDIHQIATKFGRGRVVWRYDPILLTNLTPVEFHLYSFDQIARKLAGVVDEVVISFAQMYDKTRRGLTFAAQRLHFVWWDPSDQAKRDLGAALVKLAAAQGIRLTVCSQERYLVEESGSARCVDAGRFQVITGRPFVTKQKGRRPGCGCYESRDIGEYDTCPRGCVYCYATNDQTAATARFKSHDATAECLIATVAPNDRSGQTLLPLFKGDK